MVILYCVIAILLIINICQFIQNHRSSKLPVIAVPDEATALRIAESVLITAYGNTVLDKRPFIVSFNNVRKIWNISGSLPPGYVGGVPEITIRQKDSRILNIYHSM